MTGTPPLTLGRYHLEGELGRGMMGVVYRAYDPVLGRPVALKTVSAAFASLAGEGRSFEQRFITEARVAAGLSHPGIVVVHDVGRDADTGDLFIALEHLQGRTLAEVAGVDGPLPWREALRMAAGVASALDHAHAAGVIHRDVKPANIMVLPSGETKIMDFGIAKVASSELTSAGEFFGTPLYMSPEQATGEPVDARSDIFSLGSVLFFLLTGRRAFEAPSVPGILTRVAHHDPPPPSSFRTDIPPAVDVIVARCLAKSKDDRYPTARLLAEDASAVADGRPLPERPGWPALRRAEGTLAAEHLDLVAPAAEMESPLPAEALPAAASREPEPANAARPSRRGSNRYALGAALFVTALVAFTLWNALTPVAPGSVARNPGSGSGRREILPVAAPAPARLHLALDHSLKSGTVKVWVDDALVLEEALTSRVRRKVLLYEARKGSLRRDLDIAPGEHVVRVAVASGDWSASKRIRGAFAGGSSRRLVARVEGLLDRDLALGWGASEPTQDGER